jgi:hypothetical protein
MGSPEAAYSWSLVLASCEPERILRGYERARMTFCSMIKRPNRTSAPSALFDPIPSYYGSLRVVQTSHDEEASTISEGI